MSWGCSVIKKIYEGWSSSGLKGNCSILYSKAMMAKQLVHQAIESINQKKPLIWLETCGCSGNIISLMNAMDPDLTYFLTEMVDLRYNNSLMVEEGEAAFERFLKTLEEPFILVIEGAISLRDEGLYNVIASFDGRPITGKEAARMASEKAEYILSVGTCATYGGISAASPNPAECISVPEYITEREVIRVPGCPGHPDWVIGTIAHILSFGKPVLDEQGRPLVFYGITIHDICPRRSYFDLGIFAERLGEETCMFQLGCRGPITKTDCPYRRWNSTDNWPVGDNTPCIGCAAEGFPDEMSPFVNFDEKEQGGNEKV